MSLIEDFNRVVSLKKKGQQEDFNRVVSLIEDKGHKKHMILAALIKYFNKQILWVFLNMPQKNIIWDF